MGKPSGSQRPSSIGVAATPPKQVHVKHSREELIALGDSSVDSAEDHRSQSSKARAEKARRKREKKKQRRESGPDEALDALLQTQCSGAPLLALQCHSPSPSHAATEVATEYAASPHTTLPRSFGPGHTPLQRDQPNASSVVAPLLDATITRRDLDSFGERLSGVFARTLNETVVPKFEAMESRIAELERKYLGISSQAPGDQRAQPIPSTPPPPGPRPPSTPSRGTRSKPPMGSPQVPRGSPRRAETSGRALSFPP
eukprot:4416134-Amphidinium_carterae.1